MAKASPGTVAPASGDPGLGAGVVDAAAAVGAAEPQQSNGGTATGTPDPRRARPTTGSRIGAAPPAPTGPAAAGEGSLSVDLTSPVVTHASVAADVACTESTRYRAEVARTAIGQGWALAVTVTVPGYRGPGDYSGTVLVTLTGPTDSVPVPAAVSVTLRDSGGSTAVDDGVLVGTVTWTCG